MYRVYVRISSATPVNCCAHSCGLALSTFFVLSSWRVNRGRSGYQKFRIVGTQISLGASDPGISKPRRARKAGGDLTHTHVVANCLPSAGVWESYGTSPTCLNTVPSHTGGWEVCLAQASAIPQRRHLDCRGDPPQPASNPRPSSQSWLGRVPGSPLQPEATGNFSDFPPSSHTHTHVVVAGRRLLNRRRSFLTPSASTQRGRSDGIRLSGGCRRVRWDTLAVKLAVTPCMGPVRCVVSPPELHANPHCHGQAVFFEIPLYMSFAYHCSPVRS